MSRKPKTLVLNVFGLLAACGCGGFGAHPPVRLAFTVQPTGAFAGVAMKPLTVSVQDGVGNTVSSASMNITVAIGTNAGSGTLSGAITVAAVGGVATFSNLSLDSPGSGYTLTASANGSTTATSSPFDVAPDGLVFTAQPTDTLNGQTISPVAVTVQASDGTIASSANMNVTVAIGTNPNGGTLSGATTVASVGGVATFSNLSLDRPGSGYTLMATANGASPATSNPFNIFGPPTQLGFARIYYGSEFSTDPSRVGQRFSVRVVVQDALGNTVTEANQVVTVAIGQGPAGSTLSGTLSSAAVNGVARFSDLSIGTPAIYTLIASAAGLSSAISSPFVVYGPSNPCFSWKPDPVSFGTNIIGTTSAPESLTVTNCGTQAAELTSGHGLRSFTPSDFPQTNNCPTFLDAGASCTFEVAFSPTGPGPRLAALIFNSDLIGEGFVELTGTGIRALFVAVAPDSTGKFGKFAYVTNANSNTVAMFSINADGTLTALVPAKVATGTNPTSMAIDPSGKFAYVANAGSNDVSMYAVGADGILASLGSPMAAGSVPISVAVAPDPTGRFGKFAYVANENSNNVSMFSINTDGTLTPLGTVDVGLSCVSVAVHPSGKFAYVACGEGSLAGASAVYTFTINSTTGALTPAGTQGLGESNSSIAVDPSGDWAAVTDYFGGVDICTINPTTGALSDVYGGYSHAAGYSSLALPIHPSGTLLVYVTRGAPANDVSFFGYFTACDGTRQCQQFTTHGATVAAGSLPTSIAIDPSGKFAYVGNSGSLNVSMYSINADGMLTPLVPATIGL
jgi:6-phosphogluconolactonase (cycloisomerase 2 family)